MDSMNNCDKIIYVLNILPEFNNRTVPINKFKQYVGQISFELYIFVPSELEKSMQYVPNK